MLDFFKKKGGETRELYMGLVLKESDGLVLLLEIDTETKTIHTLDQKKFTYTNSWEHLTEDVDQVLFELEKRNSVEIEKTVLFLYSHLIDQEKKSVKPQYKTKIRDMASELGLEIVGYAQFHEAVSLYYHQIEMTPLSAIIIELDGAAVSIFVYKAGALQHAQTIAQTNDFIADLEAVFKSQNGSFLPTRMILYDSTDLEDMSDKIMNHTWDEKLFIQIPKVEILPEEQLTIALTACFSKQMFEDIPTSSIGEEESRVLEAASAGALIDSTDESKQDLEPEQVTKESASPPLDPSPPPLEPPISGFLVGEDIALQEGEDADSDIVEEMAVEIPKSAYNDLLNNDLPVKKHMKLPSFTFPSLSLPKISFKYGMPALVIIGFVLIFISLFSLFYLFHKATITLYYKTPTIVKDVVIGGIAVEKMTKQTSDSEKVNATGKNTIGEKAKGEITVYNLEKQEKTIKKGTMLKTDAGVAFTLDSDVKVASASSSTTSGGDVTIVTGKQKVNSTASEIGETGNISKDTKLTFDGINSDVQRAIAFATFTGGSKKNITTVSRNDYDLLKKKVVSKITSQANSLLKDSSPNKKVLTQLIQTKFISEAYSSEVGEEATDVSLNAKVDVLLYIYDVVQVRDRIKSTITDVIPQNYKLESSKILYSVKKAVQKDTKVTLTLHIVASPEYDIDTKKVVVAARGTSQVALEDSLKNIFHTSGYQISIDSVLPFLKNRLPFFEKNITVAIVSE
ncbi:hypothetical protein A3D80_01890 [Candidatus Roizmanbacteria bacterium RIFCSPHIGHO2_02_FULL_40_13b]|uniref:Baseplate protein J-like domain-containing protein n=1 Tax=Candidatus Roizmanbacteria bacterium RIFCSPHIGHO2_01_FULL_39_24 TaxID=1802032 RepID=A0A1F7GMJ4_9BACT|nr:MAG: hypothetical protein A2799_01630 [Candidatus Roizmanbacteria bacterium RIFCSPHIGHO2_01_FULL_39_24]OGK27841.1 MAG: hypothetical protein A3D80_01890 [Candidatus Roizmanbacteria bacterium RIFCSPHIGHO2_02_FULL_40_13b]OGK49983.1 MAG: hypothetical protein A3A56_03050 [Candidatus Roizmanbacteria bacterium RIFCSPLOWO2_01_FULL_40_32]OGK55988.1 MAG: hypothetical protein A3H83_02845 [Candidatus Roizmanbacteria bacterium RIFCSPLOWO2_02_FULL_39_8]